jgi:gliding motility-associated-like protein
LVTPTDSLILTPVNGELRLPIDSTEAGQYALRATSDIASIDITVHFMHSSTGFQDVTVLRNDTLFPLDSTMFDVTGTNTLILHDGPDNRPGTSVPTHRLVLQNGIGITPNGDGQYDDLHFESTVPVTSYSLTISDKNGIMVFHSTDPDETWNGNMLNTGAPQPTGLYIYGLVFNDTTENGKFLLER